MKKVFTILAAVLLSAGVYLPHQASAQVPEKMSYQAVIRDASDNLVTERSIGMQISILQGSASGTEVYVERQFPGTNANGLVSIEIGTGTIVSGELSAVDWTNGPYFIKTETDLNGGSNYTITGTSQLLSVPYSLHAKSADTVTGGITESDPVYGSSLASGITGADTTNWNNKLDSETDPSVPAATQTGDMQYWDGSEWITVPRGSAGQVLTIVSGVPTWVTIGATIGNPTDVYNPTTDKIWMDRNLGASQVGTSSTDPDGHGDLYQWGRGADGHESRTSTTTSTLSNSDDPGHDDFITIDSDPYDWRSPQNDNLWQGVNGINNPCPDGYRLPTEAELDAERQSWSSNDASGAANSPLKLRVLGSRRYSSGSIMDVGSKGFFWSSTVGGTYSRCLYFTGHGAMMTSMHRAFGFSVRCIKD